jgi:transposase InsO family protein
MRQFNVLANTKGFVKAYEAGLKWRSMRNKEEVKRRVDALRFWEVHGLAAATDHAQVDKRTLQRWKAALAVAGGDVGALDPESTAPKQRRVRSIPPDLEQAIIDWRTKYPRLGGKKLVPLLRKAGYDVSRPYIDRCISDLKQLGRLPNKVKLSFYAKSGTHKERKQTKVKKHRRTTKQGIEIDTVVRHLDGHKRYIITAIDVTRRVAYARAYTNHSSATARDFLKQLLRVVPFEIVEIQTDNGSEFAKHFHEACLALGIVHYHTYPRCPKMNAHIERFNRTISEEFVVYHRALLRDSVQVFNESLVEWLRWYNEERPHESLGLLAPMEYLKRNYQPGRQRW